MANNNQIYKMSNAGGFKSLTRYYDMLAGNTVWNPWEPQGAFDALASVTVPSGGVASITFSGIPTGYKHLQVRIMEQTSVFDRWRTMYYNGDTSNNYNLHRVSGDGSSVSSDGFATDWYYYEAVSGHSTISMASYVIDILDYADINKFKVSRFLGGHDNNGSGNVWYSSKLWRSSAAINSITFSISGSGTFVQNSSFALYGVK